MSTTIVNGAPMAIHKGTQDRSGRVVPVEPEALPQHLPLIPLLCQRGTKEPMIHSSGATRNKMYGAMSFEYREKYSTHSTLLANTILAEGNSICIARMETPGAKTAGIALKLEVVFADIPVYERNLDGTFKLDADGQRIPTGEMVDGHMGRWVLEPLSDPYIPGANQPISGTLPGKDGEVSTIYPIMEIPAGSFGEYGNNLGFSLSAPTAISVDPTDSEVVLGEQAYMYRLKLAERANSNSTPKVTPTLDGAQFVDFMFKSGTINRKTDQEISFDKIVMPSYQDLDTSTGQPPVYAPVGDMHVYHKHLETVLKQLDTAEKEITSNDDDIHLFNIVGASYHDGTPYHTFMLDTTSAESIRLAENSTHYLVGGLDGDTSVEAFENAVSAFMDDFETSEYELMDQAKYPVRVVYDSGFALEHKKKLLIPMGLRKDIYTVLSTQDVSEPINSAAEDRSIGIALRTAASMYPESTYYGTPVCRAVIVGRCAESISNVNYPNKVPTTIDFARKSARYMGAGNGQWKAGAHFDEAPNNQIEGLVGIRHLYAPARNKILDWEAGLVTIARFDRQRQFYPGLQTVYTDDTSILNSAMNMFIVTDLDLVCQRTWASLSGTSRLTKSQFIERSNKLIVDLTANRYDERTIIEPRTFFTPTDDARGYSWSCEIHVYANNMKTVGSFGIIVHRRDDFEG